MTNLDCKRSVYAHNRCSPLLGLWSRRGFARRYKPRTMAMAVTTSTTPVRKGAPRSRPTTPTEKAAAETGSEMVETISGMIYSGSYAFSYDVV